MIVIRGVCPANTPRSNPYRLRRVVPFTTIKRVHIISYEGSDELLHVRMLRGSAYWIPDDGSWIPLAGVSIVLEERRKIDREPNTIFVEAYNEDTVNDHAFVIILEEEGDAG